MPNISVYLDNDVYIAFISSDSIGIRKKIVELIKEEVRDNEQEEPGTVGDQEPAGTDKSD